RVQGLACTVAVRVYAPQGGAGQARGAFYLARHEFLQSVAGFSQCVEILEVSVAAAAQLEDQVKQGGLPAECHGAFRLKRSGSPPAAGDGGRGKGGAASVGGSPGP